METRASYILVGSFVAVLMLGLVAFVGWLGGTSLTQTYDRYRILFEGTVTGLQIGSPVRFQGITVGSVASIRLDPTNIDRVLVVVDLEPGTPVREGSVATLQAQGITGVVFVLISGGEGTPPLRADAGAPDRPPLIDSQPSGLQAAFDAIPAVVEGVNDLIARANTLLGPDNQRSITEILINVNTLSAALADQAATFDSTLENTNQVLENLAAITTDIRDRSGPLLDQAQATLASAEAGLDTASSEFALTATEIRDLSDAFQRSADQVTALIQENRVGIQTFTENGLFEFTLMVAEIRQLANNLSRVAEGLERDRANFLFGGGQGVNANVNR